jgi:hypothetical protein
MQLQAVDQTPEQTHVEWNVDKEAAHPSEFDSLFTNHHGERWWCRVNPEGHFQVWGSDTPGVATLLVRQATVAPWIMSESESAWLQANLLRQERLQEARDQKPASA